MYYSYDYQWMLNAIKTLNEYHVLPIEGCLTQFSESSFTLHDGSYIIAYDEYWTSILGTPIEITL